MELQPTATVMNARLNSSYWDGTERRSPNSCRRNTPDRRQNGERRRDPRTGEHRKRSLLSWLRSLTRKRLGVDRRKGTEQRLFERRCSGPRSLLTQKELEELLK